MKILFLGTSAGWPLPRIGCQCPLCQSTDPKDKRLRPVVLVNETFLIDSGPDIYHQLIKNKVNVPHLKALILTHAHLDHLLGFYDLTHLYNRGQKFLKLITTQEILNDLRQSFPYPIFPFQPRIVKPNETAELENTKITLIPVKHSQRACFGIKIKAGRLFAYLPDLRGIAQLNQRTLTGLDLLVLDGSSWDKHGQTKTHLSIQQGVKLAKILKAKKVLFTHIGHLTGLHQEIENRLTEFGPNFHLAYDGLEIEL